MSRRNPTWWSSERGLCIFSRYEKEPNYKGGRVDQIYFFKVNVRFTSLMFDTPERVGDVLGQGKPEGGSGPRVGRDDEGSLHHILTLEPESSNRVTRFCTSV